VVYRKRASDERALTSSHEAVLPDFERLGGSLAADGPRLRLSLLCHLARGEQAVGDLAAATGQSFSLVSQQLALLRKAGLVQTRREAKQVYVPGGAAAG
jgi:DNA-binding transcriptional ArsR family regulator